MKRSKERLDETSGRPDGRKATSMYLRPDILVALKKAAIDADRNAYEIVEDALTAYLKKSKRA